MARWFLIACLCTSACSFALTGPDASRPRNKAPECDTGKGLVTLDGLTGTGLGIAAIALAGNNNSSAQSAALVPGLLAALYIGGAIRGNRVVNECREAMAEYAGESSGPPISGPPLAGPPGLGPRASGLRPPAPKVEEGDAPRPKTASVKPVKPSVKPEPEPTEDKEPVSAPEPAPKPVPPATPAKPAKAPEPAKTGETWTDFWKEVP